MISSTSSCEPASTSEQDSLISHQLTDKFLRAKFEALLTESSDDEGETTMPETIDSEAKKKNTAAHSEAACNRKIQGVRSEDEPDEIILSMIWMKSHLGAAYYNVQTSELFVMDDVMDDIKNHDITKALYRQCQPCHVITITGIANDFLDVVKKIIVTDTTPNADASTSSSSSSSSSSLSSSSTSSLVRVSLKLLPKNEYSYDNCYRRVQCLKLKCQLANATNAGRSTFLNSFLNFKSQLMIHALGLLLKYIDVNWSDLALDPSGRAEFVDLNYVMLKDLVMIDDDTYQALGIVQSRFHPSLFKYGSHTSKTQGMSLFTLLNRCQSRPGTLYLWKLLRHPTRNIATLNRRFEIVRFFLDPKNQNVAETLKICLAHIYRLPSSILHRHSAPHAKVSDWNKLYKTLSQVICIGDTCSNYRDANSLFAKIADSITDEMHIIRYFIDYIVDLVVGKIQQKLVVKPGVDPVLDELNNTRQQLPQILTEMAEKDIRKYALVMEACRMIYVPNIRYVLAVTAWDGEPPKYNAVPGLEFKFSINGIRHYKSDGARELDDTIGDVVMKIINRQNHIIRRLVRYISRYLAPLLKSIELCAELDTLLSFAIVARDHNYVMPKIVDNQVIDIKRGRHPLNEILATFIPNDTLSGKGNSLVKILTGPNACGKSVYLKQVALIVFMAHIGSFVPAESATIGIVTHILTQINSFDSLELNTSSFLLGLRQISIALYSSTPTSIVIMDEFGTGTSEIDGLALLAAVLQSFVDRGPYCPHIFAATHIQRVLKLLPQTPIIQAQTFEFLTEKNNLVFLHRLINGNTVGNFAHSVAKSAGLNEDIVERARQVFEAKKQGILPAPLEMSKQDTIIKYMMEMLAESGPVDVSELKMLVTHAMAKRPLYS